MIVKFMVNATGAVVEKTIESYYEAQKFIQKLRHSKKCTLLSYWSL